MKKKIIGVYCTSQEQWDDMERGIKYKFSANFSKSANVIFPERQSHGDYAHFIKDEDYSIISYEEYIGELIPLIFN